MSSISNGSASWGYSWNLSGTTLTATVTDPLTHVRVTTADINRVVLLTDKDGLNRTTTYQYDNAGRLAYIVPPEGAIVSGTPTTGYRNFLYDARGNVTCTMSVSKTASTAQTCALPSTADKIVTLASYPASCTNQLICNKPITTTDALGRVTDYTYDTSTGFVLSETYPAPFTGGIRPQNRDTYSSLYGYYKQASGGLPVPAPTPIVKLTAVSTCATSASCSNGTDEIKTKLDYGPQTSGTLNNLLPRIVSRGSGDGSLTASTSTVYDMVGNVYTVDGPLPGTSDTTRYRFDAVHQLVGAVGPRPDPDGPNTLNNRAVRYSYNLDGQPTRIERGTVLSQSDADWVNFASLQQVDTKYDTLGRKISDAVSDGTTTFSVAQYSYDAANRADCSAQRMDATKFGALPSSACALTEVGSPDRIVKNGYNAANELINVTTGYLSPVQRVDQTYTYTNNGRLATLLDGKSNLTTFEYDGFDRQLKTRFPSPATQNSSSTTDYRQILLYDAASNVKQLRQRDGTIINLYYDDLNRLITKDLPSGEPDVTYGYNLLGQATSMSSSIATLGFTYDQLGRVTRQAGPQGNTDSVYDLAGRRTKLTWPDGFYLTYDYFVTNEMSHIRESGATSGIGVLATFLYDDLGHRKSLTRGNGAVTSYTFDGDSRLTILQQDLAGTAWDQTQTFTSYNPANQITGQTRSNDAYAFTQSYNANRDYTTNGLNQYTGAGSIIPTYDARGNLTNFAGNNYSYSSENLLTSAPGNTSLSYDPMLRLYQISGGITSRFSYDGTDAIAEYDGSNNLRRRTVFGPGTDEPLVWYEGSGTTDRRWLHADERGSITAISNDTAAAIAVNSYDEYGMPATGNMGRFQYTGQMWLPETGSTPNGLYNYKARVYSPRLGGFLQTDPIGYGDGVNMYNYVHSDPVNNSDPSGLQCGTDCENILVWGDIWRGFSGFPSLPSTTYSQGGGAITPIPPDETPPMSDIVVTANKTKISPFSDVILLPIRFDLGSSFGPQRDNTGRRNRLACNYLLNNNFNAEDAWNAAVNDRNPGTRDTARSWNNIDLRLAENFLYAAYTGPSDFEIWFYQNVTKPWKRIVGPGSSPYSEDAIQAGYAGTRLYGKTPKEIAQWCQDATD
ncbi:hypothetical protein PX554_00005 [Sphingomonas sp. H39-1-10]|uniref:RHS repeat domain-containing protein n=1 Tax=Sphingomonas pollutisoli TaxID=3030829 RepID=UPI0023B8AF2D|nr:RHS repeat-associated core domain-containing protein [Sphingomonas pollutisoli]MDF0486496.1 hypothetical protein [Sphingomonas pollutisoli]